MIDKQNMLAVLDAFPEQVKKGYFELAEKIKVEGEFDKIVFAGMGGSGLAGEVLKTYLKDTMNIPILNHKSYGLPKFVDKKTLLFVVSYSGNTEETLDAYKDSHRTGCSVVVITSGGTLMKLAKSHKHPLVEIPAGIQPRLSVGYCFFGVLRVLENSGLIGSHKKDVDEIVEKLHNPNFKMQGEDLATHLVDKTPIIYTSDTMDIVGYMWKIGINENAKTTAFCNFFPELNHNEMTGWTNPKGVFHVILLREDDCHRRVAKRFKITKDLVTKDEHISTTEMVVRGDSKLLKIWTSIYIGYWTSYFLALKYKIDPTPVEMQEQFKKKL